MSFPVLMKKSAFVLPVAIGAILAIGAVGASQGGVCALLGAKDGCGDDGEAAMAIFAAADDCGDKDGCGSGLMTAAVTTGDGCGDGCGDGVATTGDGCGDGCDSNAPVQFAQLR